ncbi:MAG: Rrf2 family transcriptional regulator [Sphingobacteriia bacterium]|nr:Rrf2 family transcriptional regulator [Sphingobacteriia bacterium]
MMLTSRGRYAVMAMVHMAKAADKTIPISLGEISVEQNIPLNYLEQIFAKLRKNNLVTSTKGPGGGYRLSRKLKEINVGEIVQAVEEPIKITRCNNEEKLRCMPNQTKCLTHNLWEELSKEIEKYLDSVTLDDFSNGRFVHV